MAPNFRIGKAQRQGGFSYVLALFAVALLSVLTIRALENSMTTERREREAELLLVGGEFRAAIGKYYEQSPGLVKRYPPTLEALLLDGRASRTQRYLRRIYRDPISRNAAWGLVEAPDGGVMGVYSLSSKAPIKMDGFPPELKDFTHAIQYKYWQFIYQPTQ